MLNTTSYDPDDVPGPDAIHVFTGPRETTVHVEKPGEPPCTLPTRTWAKFDRQYDNPKAKLLELARDHFSG